MTCCTSGRIYSRGSVEYVEVEITSDNVLDAQPVEFSFEPSVWLSATWQGAPGTSRVARVLMDFGTLYRGTYTLRVRITDAPEVPIIDVTQIEVRG